MEEKNTKNAEVQAPAITAGTVIRTLVLIVALANQCLTALGKSPLPFSDEEIQQYVTLAFTVVAAVAAWWKNNSFTAPARMADEVMSQIKAAAGKTGAQQ